LATDEIRRNTRATVKGNVMLEREFRQKDREKEASSREHPGLWEEEKTRQAMSTEKSG
jgi:hypothetical protein